MRIWIFPFFLLVVALSLRAEMISPSQSRLTVSSNFPVEDPAAVRPSLEDLNLTQGRLSLAQTGAAANSAVSSQAVANQPGIPVRVELTQPSEPVPPPQTESAPIMPAPVLDPRLDPKRPRNCQLKINTDQTFSCGGVSVTLPAGTYEQKLIVEGPVRRRVSSETPLQPQSEGLGYIRYLSDVPLKIGGVERSGGLDVPVWKEDSLPVRVWYRKMTEPDTTTRVLAFLFPPVAVVAGVGAWSSGNLLLPDSPPEFQEARDYYLKPLKPKPNPGEIPQPSHVRPLRDPHAVNSNQIRSK